MAARASRRLIGDLATLAVALVLAVLGARTALADQPTGAVVARMDELWEQREAPNSMPDLMTIGAEGAARAADPYEIEWRLARAYFWVAYTQNNRVTKRGIAGKAVEWADRARVHRADRVEGHYFYAVAIGAYADCIGVMQAVMEGIVSRFETAARRAYEIDRDFEHGAPMTMLGRYYYLLPWPKRDLDRSRRYIEEATRRHPGALIAHVYLADTYFALGERAKAQSELEFALENQPEPGSERDLPPPKPLARAAMQRWFPEAVAAGRH